VCPCVCILIKIICTSLAIYKKYKLFNEVICTNIDLIRIIIALYFMSYLFILQHNMLMKIHRNRMFGFVENIFIILK
jgi:hypothetical protein